jgi:hypothetical protein
VCSLVPLYPAYPSFPTPRFPTLPNLALSDAERAHDRPAAERGAAPPWRMELSEAYYLGEQVIDNLRIAVPGAGVPADDRRLGRARRRPLRGAPRGRLLPPADGTDADPYLTSLWSQNGLDAELPLATPTRCRWAAAWWLTGSPLESGGVPQITVESPLNLSALWNLRGTEPTALFHEYWSDGRRHAALLVPNQTISLATNDKGEWEIVDRDVHDFGFVPAVRMANQPAPTTAADARRSPGRSGRPSTAPAGPCSASRSPARSTRSPSASSSAPRSRTSRSRRHPEVGVGDLHHQRPRPRARRERRPAGRQAARRLRPGDLHEADRERRLAGRVDRAGAAAGDRPLHPGQPGLGGGAEHLGVAPQPPRPVPAGDVRCAAGQGHAVRRHVRQQGRAARQVPRHRRSTGSTSRSSRFGMVSTAISQQVAAGSCPPPRTSP